MDFLDKVRQKKEEDIDHYMAQYPPSELMYRIQKRNKFYRFKHHLSHPNRISVIGEIKYASPAHGDIREHIPAIHIALEYQAANIDALSILTDRHFFKGDFSFLYEVRQYTELPLLCKDFIIDEYQILLARAFGADAVLLIVAMFQKDKDAFKRLYKAATSLGLDVLTEVHTKDDLEFALECDCDIIGVNSRDLTTLKVDMNTFYTLIPLIPETRFVVAESGITPEFLPSLKGYRIDAVLVGNYFMSQKSIFYGVKRFIEECRRA